MVYKYYMGNYSFSNAGVFAQDGDYRKSNNYFNVSNFLWIPEKFKGDNGILPS